MSTTLPPSAQRVQKALEMLNLPCRVVEMPASTRTAGEAAAAIGCQVAQIVKSLIFRGQTSGKAILVLASGVNRVNEILAGNAYRRTHLQSGCSLCVGTNRICHRRRPTPGTCALH